MACVVLWRNGWLKLSTIYDFVSNNQLFHGILSLFTILRQQLSPKIGQKMTQKLDQGHLGMSDASQVKLHPLKVDKVDKRDKSWAATRVTIVPQLLQDFYRTQVYLVATFGTNASGVIWWTILQLM